MPSNASQSLVREIERRMAIYNAYNSVGGDKNNFVPRFETGEIVYWVETNVAGKIDIKYGVVSEQYFGIVSVDLYRPVDRRLINGIPIAEFENETRYKKLPKNWDCDVKLFEESERPFTEEEKKAVDAFNVKCPATIRAAIEAGVLVTVKSVFCGRAEADIDRHKGWRIIKKNPAIRTTHKWCKHFSL